ncbi:lipoprotein [Mycoplasma capricolum]
MKKLLTLLGSVGLIASTIAAVVACGENKKIKQPNSGLEINDDKRNWRKN